MYTGGSGVDSLTATVTNADDDGAAVTMSDIENMTVRVSGAGGVQLLMGDASGIETFTANRLGSTLTLTDMTDLSTDLVISNQSTTAILDAEGLSLPGCASLFWRAGTSPGTCALHRKI